MEFKIIRCVQLTFTADEVAMMQISMSYIDKPINDELKMKSFLPRRNMQLTWDELHNIVNILWNAEIFLGKVQSAILDKIAISYEELEKIDKTKYRLDQMIMKISTLCGSLKNVENKFY